MEKFYYVNDKLDKIGIIIIEINIFKRKKIVI